MISPFKDSDLINFEPSEHFSSSPWRDELKDELKISQVFTVTTHKGPVGFIGFHPKKGEDSAVVWSILGKEFDIWGARSLRRVVDACVKKDFYGRLIMHVEEGYCAGEELAKFLRFRKELTYWVRD